MTDKVVDASAPKRAKRAKDLQDKVQPGGLDSAAHTGTPSDAGRGPEVVPVAAPVQVVKAARKQYRMRLPAGGDDRDSRLINLLFLMERDLYDGRVPSVEWTPLFHRVFKDFTNSDVQVAD